jgi:hypothetical protein
MEEGQRENGRSILSPVQTIKCPILVVEKKGRFIRPIKDIYCLYITPFGKNKAVCRKDVYIFGHTFAQFFK